MARTAAHATKLRAVPSFAAILAAAFLAGCPSSPTPPPAVYPGIALSVATLNTAEGGAAVSFQIVLRTQPTASVSLDLCSTDTTEGWLATSATGAGSTCLYPTFTTANWNVPQTYWVKPVDDVITDGPQTYPITASVFTTMDTDYLMVPDQTLSVTNADNDVPAVTVSKTTASTSETPTTDTFTVRLATAPSATVVIPVTSTDTTEGLLRGGDSPTTSQPTINLTFTTANWSTPQTVTIYGQADQIDDGNQTYNVTVGPATGAAEYAALPAKTVAVTNLDVDTAAITITAAASPLVTSENWTTATFTVRLNTRPTANVVIPVKSGNVAEGVLSSSVQFLQQTVNLTFTDADWNVPQTVTITGVDDTATPVMGDNVTYDVTVGPATGDPVYAALASQAVPVLNVDNDVAAVIVPAAGGNPLQTVEVGAGNVATFTVGINKLPTTNVVIPITVNDVTEGLVTGGSSPTTPAQTINLTFTPADFKTAQTVTVIGQVDNLVDGNQTYTITIGTPTGDSAYTSLSPQTVTVVNADSDVAGFTVSKTALSTSEGGAVNTFTVVLNKAPVADVVIPVTSGLPSEGLVAGGSSGTTFVSTLNLTFTPANWQTPQTVQVQGQVDNIVDGTKSYTITVGPTSSTSAPYNGVAAKTISATNTDVDVASFVVTPTSGLVTTEAGGTATFTVKLTSIPMGTVTIPVSVDDTSEALVSAGGTPAGFLNLTFTSSDWNTPKTVTVTGQDDTLLDGARPFVVSVGPTTSGDAKYNALAAKTVTGSNADNDVGVSEGTVTPVSLTAQTARPNSQVGPSSSSYYVVAMTPGSSFAVSVADASAAVTLTADDDGNYAAGNLCTASVPAFGGVGCMGVVPGSGFVYIRVSTASTTGAGYTLFAGTRQTYPSTDVPKSILDYANATSSLTVAGGPPVISKVTVKLNITHTNDGDIAIYLKSPAGNEIVLSYARGGTGDNYIDTIFDDAAATSFIGSGTAPFTGTYSPEGSFYTFIGQNANGTWTLRVHDYIYLNTGTLNGWSIDVY